MTNCLLFFLWTGTMFRFFQSSGKVPDFRKFWNTLESGFIMDGLLSSSILIETPSYPWALFASNDWIIFSSFSLSKVISFSLFSVWYVLDFGRVLLFCRGWHCLLKNSLNKLAFSKKLVTSLSLTRRGGIIGFFCHLRKFWEILVKTQVFFSKNWTTTYLTITPSKSFYIIFVDVISEIIRFWNH